jgi:hypothetical protein
MPFEPCNIAAEPFALRAEVSKWSAAEIGRMMTVNDGMGIPLSRRATCVYCSIFIDTNANGVFQFASGWLENRRKGGANTIALPNRRPRFACRECIDRLRHGIPVGQGTLFGLDIDSL